MLTMSFLPLTVLKAKQWNKRCRFEVALDHGSGCVCGYTTTNHNCNLTWMLFRQNRNVIEEHPRVRTDYNGFFPLRGIKLCLCYLIFHKPQFLIFRPWITIFWQRNKLKTLLETFRFILAHDSAEHDTQCLSFSGNVWNSLITYIFCRWWSAYEKGETWRHFTLPILMLNWP